MARTCKAGTEGRARDRLTVLDVKRVGGQSQRGAAVVALEAAAVEELALGAQPLHHVDALAAEEAHVAAADVDGELFPEGALWEHQTPSVIFFFPTPFYANATQATSEDEASTHRDVWRENPGAHGSRRQTATNELARRYCYNHTTAKSV